MIYFDNAATSFHKPEAVAEAVYHALQGGGNSGRGAHEASLEAGRLLLRTREVLSGMFHVGNPSRVVFTFNATESLNIVIQGLLHPGNHCITTAMEHNSVLRPLYQMESKGVELTVLPLDKKGCIDEAMIEAALRQETKAIVLTHASNVTGNVTDIHKIGEICYRHNLLFIVDASQTAGMLPIDMKEMKITALCCSGHKGLLGPQGTGVLCLREGTLPAPMKVGGTGANSYSHRMPADLPEALEAGTQNIHGLAGLLAACEYIVEYGQANIYEKATQLAKAFIQGAKLIPGVTLYGDYDSKVRVPVVSINIRDIDSGIIADELFWRFQIATRAGAHCAPLLHEAFQTVDQGMVRFSFSHFNTIQEIQEAIKVIKILEEEYR